MPTHHTDEELRQGAERAEHALKALRELRTELKAARAGDAIPGPRTDHLLRCVSRATGKVEKIKTGYTAEMAFRERLSKWTDATDAELDYAAPIVEAIVRAVEQRFEDATVAALPTVLEAIRVAAAPHVAALIAAATEESARENPSALTAEIQGLEKRIAFAAAGANDLLKILEGR